MIDECIPQEATTDTCYEMLIIIRCSESTGLASRCLESFCFSDYNLLNDRWFPFPQQSTRLASGLFLHFVSADTDSEEDKEIKPEKFSARQSGDVHIGQSVGSTSDLRGVKISCTTAKGKGRAVDDDDDDEDQENDNEEQGSCQDATPSHAYNKKWQSYFHESL